MMIPRRSRMIITRRVRRQLCDDAKKREAEKQRELRLRQVNMLRNPPTMLKIFNPELYMDPKNSRTWKIVGGAWVIVFTTLGFMYVKELSDGDHDEDAIRQRKKETEAERKRKINEESW